MVKTRSQYFGRSLLNNLFITIRDVAKHAIIINFIAVKFRPNKKYIGARRAGETGG